MPKAYVLIVNESGTEDSVISNLNKIEKIHSKLTLLVNEKESFRKITKSEKDVLEKYMAQAFVIIHCNRSQESAILQELKKITEVVEADNLIGSFEIVCKLVAPTYNDISDIISKKIRKIANIKSTITLNVIGNQGFSK